MLRRDLRVTFAFHVREQVLVADLPILLDGTPHPARDPVEPGDALSIKLAAPVTRPLGADP
jgi:hypothetical protein